MIWTACGNPQVLIMFIIWKMMNIERWNYFKLSIKLNHSSFNNNNIFFVIYKLLHYSCIQIFVLIKFMFHKLLTYLTINIYLFIYLESDWIVKIKQERGSEV